MERSTVKILLVGSDARLAYLLGRYAEQTGLDVVMVESLPSIIELMGIEPSAIIFASIEAIRESESMIVEINELDIQVVVCAAIGDEAAAREIGADVCMFHPINFENFCLALNLDYA
jgi:DNA-binding response OmpR family regulator